MKTNPRHPQFVNLVEPLLGLAIALIPVVAMCLMLGINPVCLVTQFF